MPKASVKKYRKGRSVAFQTGWLVKYGLEIATSEAQSGEVVMAACRFCKTLGREVGDEEVERKRKRTATVRQFSPPWRSDHIARHMHEHHPKAFAEYSSLAEDKQRMFFEDRETIAGAGADAPQQAQVRPVARAPLALAGGRSEKVVYLVNADIIESIIGDIFLEPSEDESEANVDINTVRSRILSIFSRQMVGEGEDMNVDRYAAIAPSRHQMELSMSLVRQGLSFVQTASLLQSSKETSSMSMLENWSPAKVANLVRIACAINLQTVHETLAAQWAFSLSLGSASSAGGSYLDIGARFESGGRLHSVHLIGLPLRELHTQSFQCDLLVTFLSVIAPRWRTQLLAICSDSVSTATTAAELSHGVVARLCGEAGLGVYRTCSGAYQLDRVMQAAFTGLLQHKITELRSAEFLL